MKTTMKMSDLKKADGFPENVDRTQLVVVQICESELNGIILYTSKNGEQSRDLLPKKLNDKYSDKIYIINP